MTDAALTSAECAIISSILQRTLNRLVNEEWRAPYEVSESPESHAKGCGSDCTESCQTIQEIKSYLTWLTGALKEIIADLPTGCHSNLCQLLRDEEASAQARLEKANLEMKEELEEEERRREEERLAAAVAALEQVTDCCPISNMGTEKDFVYLNYQTVMHATADMAQVAQFLAPRRALMKRLNSATHRVQMQEEAMETSRRFLQWEQKQLEKETQSWDKRFQHASEELTENITKTSEDIETLRQSYQRTKEVYKENLLILEEHREKARQRQEQIELERRFRMLQSWWRGTVVRLSLGDFGSRFEAMQQKIQRRKEEEEKLLRKMQQKSGGGKKKL